MTVRRLRTRGQAMVEFGLIALLFVLMLFGIVDFGMLLNGWINVSAGSAAAARQASLGAPVGSNIVDQTATFVTSQSFSPIPGVSPANMKVAVTYGGNSYCRPSAWTGWASAGVTCTGATPPEPIVGNPISVLVIADTFEVVTPLVRPFFIDATNCPSAGAAHCYVPLKSSTTMRYEGRAL